MATHYETIDTSVKHPSRVQTHNAYGQDAVDIALDLDLKVWVTTGKGSARLMTARRAACEMARGERVSLCFACEPF